MVNILQVQEAGEQQDISLFAEGSVNLCCFCLFMCGEGARPEREREQKMEIRGRKGNISFYFRVQMFQR